MELNFTCINGEISTIINNKNKYNSYIVLICLALKELVLKIKETFLISSDFIMYLTHIREYIQCDINFNLLAYLCNNKKIIKMIDNSELFNPNLSYSISSSSDDLENKITKMLYNDLTIINKIYNLYNNDDINIIAKNIFDMVDYDSDGIISALDLLIVVNNNSNSNNINSDTILTDDFVNSIINLLLHNSCDKITFELFFNNFM
jgi:Ca2+-binding EF-hand superfamily protein